MTARTRIHDLHVADTLYEFINREVLPDVGVDAARKGRLEPRHILNCRHLADVKKYLARHA